MSYRHLYTYIDSLNVFLLQILKHAMAIVLESVIAVRASVFALKDVGYTGKQVHASFLVKEGILVPKIN